MLDMNAVGAELTALAAPAGVQTYDVPPEKPEVPALFVEEWTADLTDDGTPLGDGAYYDVSMTLLVSRSDDQESRRTRNSYLKAIADNLFEAQSVGFSDQIVTAAAAPADLRDFGGVAYVYADITVRLFG